MVPVGNRLRNAGQRNLASATNEEHSLAFNLAKAARGREPRRRIAGPIALILDLVGLSNIRLAPISPIPRSAVEQFQLAV
jgi:hypothetical protein